jgi:G3E family GTPase
VSSTQITVVAGLRASSRTAVARRVARRQRCSRLPAAALSESRDAAAVETLRRAVGAAPERMVVELPADASIEAAIGMLDDADEVTLAELVCVVDAASFFDDLLADDYVTVAHSIPPLYVASSLRMVQHIEHASTVLVAGWEGLETRDLSILLATLSHLAPAARLRLDRTADAAPPSPFSQTRNQPGWVQLLNSEHEPHMNDIRVSAFRYEQLRPFHPARLWRLLEQQFPGGDFGAVLRSAGFCRLATRPGVVGSWDQVGQMISLDPLSRDSDDRELLALGQDLAFIGIDLDAAALTAALDTAVLSDAEFAGGTREWAILPDPFPRWVTSVPAED